jgi:hypothetical protein
MTMISVWGQVCANADSSVCASQHAALWQGMMMLTSGVMS